MEADGAVATVAALRAHAGNGDVQRNGCRALTRIIAGGAACAQAVVEAGGAVAVVAALRAHAGDVDVQSHVAAIALG